MQIETTIHKAGLLRLGFYLGGGGIAEQKIDRAARDAIAETLGSIAGVQLADSGGFAFAGLAVARESVTLDLSTEQLGRAVHKLRDGQWPALSDAQLDVMEELTAEVGDWLKAAQAEETWERLPKEARDRISGTDKEKHG